MNNQPNIVISGGSKGIGRAIAALFAKKGWQVFVAARNENELKQMEVFWAEHYPNSRLVICACDLATPEGCEIFISTIKKKTQDINLLVNNLGTFEAGNLLNQPAAFLSKMLNTNFLSAHRLTLGLVGLLKKAERKSIINIGSVATTDWPEGMNCYSISKFAFQAWHKAIRQELAKEKIQVTELRPGATLTHSWEGVPTENIDLLDAKDVAETAMMIWDQNEKWDTGSITIRPKNKK